MTTLSKTRADFINSNRTFISLARSELARQLGINEEALKYDAMSSTTSGKPIESVTGAVFFLRDELSVHIDLTIVKSGDGWRVKEIPPDDFD